MKKFKITIDSETIEFRDLTAEETNRLIYFLYNNEKDPSLEEYIFSIVTDNKYDLNIIPAGIVPFITFASLKLSGILDKKYGFLNLIDQARDRLSKDPFINIYLCIIKNLGYKIEDLKQKSAIEIFDLFALSELINGEKYIDTKKSKDMIDAKLSNKVTTKSGISRFTKEEIDQLKESLKLSDMGLDGF